MTRSTTIFSFNPQKSKHLIEMRKKKQNKRNFRENFLRNQTVRSCRREERIDLEIPAAPVTRTRTGSLAIVRIAKERLETKTTPANLIRLCTHHYLRAAFIVGFHNVLVPLLFVYQTVLPRVISSDSFLDKALITEYSKYSSVCAPPPQFFIFFLFLQNKSTTNYGNKTKYFLKIIFYKIFISYLKLVIQTRKEKKKKVPPLRDLWK